MLTFDKNGRIYDTRCPLDTLFCEPLSVCYTLLSDDITKSAQRSATPYTDSTDTLVWNGAAYESARSKVKISPYLDGVLIDLLPMDSEYESVLSEYGLNLPLNFMGKKNSGGWRNQFLFNSPYMSSKTATICSWRWI